jgi:tRNA G10  N-methylase Trm11
MLPAIARAAIEAYSRPGDTVLDPMCGIGTTLVEAVHLGRDAVGVDYEVRWAEMAAANLAQARPEGLLDTGKWRSGMVGASRPSSTPRLGNWWPWW